jgi:hypothetical protein
VTEQYHDVVPPGGVSVEATAINGKGDIAGWMTTKKGTTVSFLLKGGSFSVYSAPHATETEALGINWQDQVVGSYQEGSVTHGFVLNNPLEAPQWQTVDEPDADGSTVLTSIQDQDYMVGYYKNAAGHTNGFLAIPVK